jgi:hypothetical protein
MSRRSKVIGLDSSANLARKVEILEREMAAQRAALDRLKEMGSPRSTERGPRLPHDAKR